jgi:Uma2 family endonuclease
LYAEAGAKEYWIVLGREHLVEVFRRPEQGRYQEQRVFGADEALDCVAVPGVHLSLRACLKIVGADVRRL